MADVYEFVCTINHSISLSSSSSSPLAASDMFRRRYVRRTCYSDDAELSEWKSFSGPHSPVHVFSQQSIDYSEVGCYYYSHHHHLLSYFQKSFFLETQSELAVATFLCSATVKFSRWMPLGLEIIIHREPSIIPSRCFCRISLSFLFAAFQGHQDAQSAAYAVCFPEFLSYYCGSFLLFKVR